MVPTILCPQGQRRLYTHPPVPLKLLCHTAGHRLPRRSDSDMIEAVEDRAGCF
jgi:hypothetical protein